jgi:hypothetical protein
MLLMILEAQALVVKLLPTPDPFRLLFRTEMEPLILLLCEQELQVVMA